MKSLPLNFISTRTHQIWPRISLSAMGYEEILNVENLEGELKWLKQQEKHLVCQPTEAFAVKIRQDLLSGCFWIGFI